ncbi:alcohol dehydrogenase [Dactylonectria macrodidyma]|uniref:Alcohol dehydrogenase n=1 Tax=Dactylonectria macrodidyma TaxID=307937 RepID=A0A9P9JGV9_9HYPO|nr:alcohol dehydrogenase [Dactylonectria macrodidyma]
MQSLFCVLYGAGKVRFENRPIPTIDDPQLVLINVAFVGVCGNDPLVMGHEASDVVHAVGSAVTTVKPNDRVAMEPGFACRRCRYCKSLTRIYKLPEDFVFKIPSPLSLEEAGLLEPLSVAAQANRLPEPVTGRRILALRPATIGLLSAAVARDFAAIEIHVAYINEQKLMFAKGFWATLRSSLAFRGTGFGVVLECTGVESPIQTGMVGKCIQAFPLMAVGEKELSIKGGFRYGAGDHDLGLDLLTSEKADVIPLISDIVPFESTLKACEMTARGDGIKNLIRVCSTDWDTQCVEVEGPQASRAGPFK